MNMLQAGFNRAPGKALSPFVPDRHVDVRASDGVRLSATLSGPENGPALLLVHGYPDDSRVWDPVCRLLAEDFRLIRFDVRGAGASQTPAQPTGYGLPQLADDIFSVIKACHPEGPVHLVGHDWGAIQAWEAATDARADTALRSLSVISGPCLDHVGNWMRQQWRARDIAGLSRQLASSWYIAAFHLPLFAPTLWRAGFDRLWPSLLEKREQIVEEPGSDRRRDGINGIQLYRNNIIERLRQPRERYCQIPVQILIPEQDAFVGGDIMASARPWVKQLSMESVDAGHWVPLSHPDKVASWLKRHHQSLPNMGANIGKQAAGG